MASWWRRVAPYEKDYKTECHNYGPHNLPSLLGMRHHWLSYKSLAYPSCCRAPRTGNQREPARTSRPVVNKTAAAGSGTFPDAS